MSYFATFLAYLVKIALNCQVVCDCWWRGTPWHRLLCTNVVSLPQHQCRPRQRHRELLTINTGSQGAGVLRCYPTSRCRVESAAGSEQWTHQTLTAPRPGRNSSHGWDQQRARPQTKQLQNSSQLAVCPNVKGPHDEKKMLPLFWKIQSNLFRPSRKSPRSCCLCCSIRKTIHFCGWTLVRSHRERTLHWNQSLSKQPHCHLVYVPFWSAEVAKQFIFCTKVEVWMCKKKNNNN